MEILKPGIAPAHPRPHASCPPKPPATELDKLFSRHSLLQHFQPDSIVLLHGEPASMLYRIESGIVRCCTIGAEGHRQIFSFASKGDFIGISDIEQWHFTAEAVDCVTLRAVSRDVVERELKGNVILRHEFRSKLVHLLQRREEQLLAVISQKAHERLFRFLCDFASTRRHAHGAPIALPMCRRDIADHLGLSVETVSRAFSELKRSGKIELVTCEKYRIVPQPVGNALRMAG